MGVRSPSIPERSIDSALDSGACRSGMATFTDDRCSPRVRVASVGMSPPRPLFRAVAGLDPHPPLPAPGGHQPPIPFGLVAQRPEPPVTAVEITTDGVLNSTVPSEARGAPCGRDGAATRHRPGSTPGESFGIESQHARSPWFDRHGQLVYATSDRHLWCRRWSARFDFSGPDSYSYHSTRTTGTRDPVRAPHKNTAL